MSKKVLNYAGKRPMLLALTIMATLTLGLLFSGWLTPTTGRAQGGPNPPPNQENTNCPPVWGAWQADPNNLPTISITFAAPGDQCVEIKAGSTSGSMSVSAGSPTNTAGGKFQVDTSGCGNANNTGTLAITPGTTTWTASGCGATPSSGTTETATFSVNASGSCTVTFTAHGITSDPSGTYDSSAASQTFNVNVGNENLIISRISQYDWPTDWATQLANLAGSRIALSPSVAGIKISGNDIISHIGFCCNNNSASADYEVKTVNSMVQDLQCSAGTTSLGDLANTFLNQALDAAGVNVPGFANAITSWCGTAGGFSLANVKASCTGNFRTISSYSDSCQCSGTSSAWFGTDSVLCNATIGTLPIPASVIQKFSNQQNFSINIVVLSASINYSKHGSSMNIGSGTTGQNSITTIQSSDVHTYIQVGSFRRSYYAIGSPFNDTSTQQTTYCNGRFFPN